MIDVFDKAASQPWAIHAPAFQTMIEIAGRQDVTPESLAAWKPNAEQAEKLRIEALSMRGGDLLANTRGVVVRDGVATVSINGPIFRHANLMTDLSGATSLGLTAKEFGAAVDSPAVKAIILSLDSPGGQANGIAEFQAAVRSANAIKPVVAYVGGMSTSAAYFIASGAGEIVVDRMATLGSIGIIATLRDTSAIDQSRGVKTYNIVSSQSPLKNADPGTEAGMASLQAYVDRLAQEFINAVAEARGVAPEKVMADFGQGGLLVGADAVAAGMADALGSYEQTISRLASANPVRTAVHMPRLNAAAGGPSTAQLKETDMSDQQKGPQPDCTAAELRQNFASAVAQIETEAKQAERSRVLAIQSAAFAGQQDLVSKLISDGVDAGAAALALNADEKQKGSRILAEIKSAEPAEKLVPAAGGADAVASQAAIDAALPLEDRCKRAWDKDPALRAEFRDKFDAYLAFEKATASGQARILKK
ncbi:MAG: S49 family peptidase [Alphaproteobacteria bacterium]|nr:S49 family peptidase [Alphaproteobacteria bacterium]